MSLAERIKRLFRARRDYVLVVGGSHIDVMADYDANAGAKARLDKVGRVRYAVGGTAFNIAVNLGQRGVQTALLTVLKENSFSSVWIEERLASGCVERQFVQYSDRITESGFVAIRRDGDLESAVTSTGIAQHGIDTKVLNNALSDCRFVVADCNLSADQLRLVSDFARRHGKLLAVAATSDSKVGRILTLNGEQAELVFLNEPELRAAFDGQLPLVEAENARRICNQLRARTVVLTLGARGYSVIRVTGAVTSFPAPDVERIASTSGGGDAVAAGILKYWFDHKTLNFSEAAKDVAPIVATVLEQEGATIGALAQTRTSPGSLESPRDG